MDIDYTCTEELISSVTFNKPRQRLTGFLYRIPVRELSNKIYSKYTIRLKNV